MGEAKGNAEMVTTAAEFLTDDEIDRLLVAALSDGRTASEDELTALIHWAQMTRLRAELLAGVLAGRLTVAGVTADGEPLFGTAETVGAA